MKLIDMVIEIVLENPVILREVVKEHLGWMIQKRYCPWHFGIETERESLCHCGEDQECDKCWDRTFTGRKKEDRKSSDDCRLVRTAHKPSRTPKYSRQAAIVMGYCDGDNDVTYMCPVCEKKFGGWSASTQPPNVYGSSKYCPECKTELRF